MKSKNSISIFLFVLISLFASQVFAQTRRTQLLFGRLCVNETGFQITDDAPAMAEALRSRRDGELTPGIIIAYSRHTVTRRHEIRTNRRWISFLNPMGSRPTFWRRDSSVRWSRMRRRWLEIYERAGRIVLGKETSHCDEPPEHWYAQPRTARERERVFSRMRRGGFHPVDCGNTLNIFFSRHI